MTLVEEIAEAKGEAEWISWKDKDYVEGSHLSDVLKKPTLDKQEKEILNLDIDNMTLDIVYRDGLALLGCSYFRMGRQKRKRSSFKKVATSEDPSNAKI
jgi:hypothetical protein